MERKIQFLLKTFPQTYSEELGIDLKGKKSSEVFKWFLASILFGHRIGEAIAKSTYREFEKEGLTTPQKIIDAGWDRLVKVLDRGGYNRYDFSTASAFLDIMENLQKKYGSLEDLQNLAKDEKDLEAKLEEFKRVGPVTVNIFLRELRNVWPKANPELSPIVKLAAKNLGIDLEHLKRKTEGFVRLECGLLRVGKDWCRKNKCTVCHLKEFCGHRP